MKEITPEEFRKLKEGKEDFQLIDVRELHEVEIVHIGGDHFPMAEVTDHLDKIAKDKKVIVHCKAGGRSGAVVQMLEKLGYTNVYNLKGGILGYIDNVDPSLPRY